MTYVALWLIGVVVFTMVGAPLLVRICLETPEEAAPAALVLASVWPLSVPVLAMIAAAYYVAKRFEK